MRIEITPTGDKTGREHYRRVTIETPGNDCDAEEFIRLLSDAMLAWGFNKSTVQDYIRSGDIGVDFTPVSPCRESVESRMVGTVK